MISAFGLLFMISAFGLLPQGVCSYALLTSELDGKGRKEAVHVTGLYDLNVWRLLGCLGGMGTVHICQFDIQPGHQQLGHQQCDKHGGGISLAHFS